MERKDRAEACSDRSAKSSDASELSDDQLEAVSGGTDPKKKTTTSDQHQYLEIKITDVLISSYNP